MVHGDYRTLFANQFGRTQLGLIACQAVAVVTAGGEHADRLPVIEAEDRDLAVEDDESVATVLAYLEEELLILEHLDLELFED